MEPAGRSGTAPATASTAALNLASRSPSSASLSRYSSTALRMSAQTESTLSGARFCAGCASLGANRGLLCRRRNGQTGSNVSATHTRAGRRDGGTGTARGARRSAEGADAVASGLARVGAARLRGPSATVADCVARRSRSVERARRPAATRRRRGRYGVFVETEHRRACRCRDAVNFLSS